MNAIPIKTRYKMKGTRFKERCKKKPLAYIGSVLCRHCEHIHSKGVDEKGSYIRCKVNKLIR